MSITVTKQMVELYTLGVLPPDRRRQIEAAFDASPQVQEWFLELGELPEHVQAEALESELLDQFAAHRSQGANESDRALFEFAAAHASAPEDAPDAPREDNVFGRLSALIASRSQDLGAALAQLVDTGAGASRRTMDFTEALAGAPPITPTYPTGATGDDICEQRGESISIKGPVAEIPHGLVWLGLVEANGAVTMHLPRLERILDHWVGRIAVRDLLDGRCPVSPVETFLVPARLANRAAFDCDEVRRFLTKLDEDSEQRLAAEALLATENDDHE